MNRITVNQLSWSVVSLALIVVVLIALALLGLVTIIAYRIVARHRRVPTIPATTRFPERTTLREIARCWVAPTGVMAVFIALSGEFGRELERWFSLTPFVSIPAAVEPHESLVRTENPYQRAETDPAHIRPSWIDERNSQTGDVQRIVLSSGLWATEAEAIRELLPRTASIVRTDFAERHKGPFDRPGHRFLSDERLANIAVKRQYLERIEQDHGSIVLPMCRLWQQLARSPHRNLPRLEVCGPRQSSRPHRRPSFADDSHCERRVAVRETKSPAKWQHNIRCRSRRQFRHGVDCR